MDSSTKDIQLQYEGFLNAETLWKDAEIFNLSQFELETNNVLSFNEYLPKRLMLGKRVERFVSHLLQQSKSVKILAENIQISQDKITLGEIDCLIIQNNVPIHLEIVYKFYLYDDTVGTNELERWIGPNRKDSFIEKLDKLKNKQFPLLFKPETQFILETLKLKSSDIQQQVYFKAQLFVPLNKLNQSFKLINNQCIKGFFIYPHELKQFDDCKFYIPNKPNWLIESHNWVDWLTYDKFTQQITQQLNTKKAPLCWLKKTNGELFKFFVVWWY